MSNSQFVETIDDKAARAIKSGRFFSRMLRESDGKTDSSLYRDHRHFCEELDFRRSLSIDEAMIDAVYADLCAAIDLLSPGRAKRCIACCDEDLVFDPRVEILCDLLHQLTTFRTNRDAVLDWAAGERVLRKLLQ